MKVYTYKIKGELVSIVAENGTTAKGILVSQGITSEDIQFYCVSRTIQQA